MIRNGSIIQPRFHVHRSTECVNCRKCIAECSFGVHSWDEKNKRMKADSSKCVDCQRCVVYCPVDALSITRNENIMHPNHAWCEDSLNEIYRQAETGGVLLSSMGAPDRKVPSYFPRILLNASQVTNPSIDPLREPMETTTFIGRRPESIERDLNGKLIDNLPPHLELKEPIMFAAMSYGAVSLNVHKALAMASEALGTYWNTGEGGLHEDLYKYGKNTIVQVASGRFGVHPDYLSAGAAVEIKIGQGAKPGIGGHLTGAKIHGDIAKTRMVPEGIDAISPAPHHDI